MRDTGVREAQSSVSEPGAANVIIAQTGKDAKYLHLTSAYSAQDARWSKSESEVLETGDAEVWTVEHVFGGEGTYVFDLSGSLDGENPGDVTTLTAEVAREVISVSLDRNSLALDIGAAFRLDVSTEPDNGRVVWSTEDPSVAVVDDNGRVIAVGTGQTAVTVSALNGTACDIAQIEVISFDTDVSTDVFVLPADLKQLEEAALSGVSAEIVILPQSVLAVGPCVFAGCESLAFVVFPDGPIDLDERMLDGCTARAVCTPGSPADLWFHSHDITPIYLGE